MNVQNKPIKGKYRPIEPEDRHCYSIAGKYKARPEMMQNRDS